MCREFQLSALTTRIKRAYSTFSFCCLWPCTSDPFKSSRRHPRSKYNPAWSSMTAGDTSALSAPQLSLKCIHSRLLHSRLIPVLADPPTQPLKAHTPLAPMTKSIIFSSKSQICSPRPSAPGCLWLFRNNKTRWMCSEKQSRDNRNVVKLELNKLKQFRLSLNVHLMVFASIYISTWHMMRSLATCT